MRVDHARVIPEWCRERCEQFFPKAKSETCPRAPVLISDCICNQRREVGDVPDVRLPFGFRSVSVVSFLHSVTLIL
jgi:hypothetical protein